MATITDIVHRTARLAVLVGSEEEVERCGDRGRNIVMYLPRTRPGGQSMRMQRFREVRNITDVSH